MTRKLIAAFVLLSLFTSLAASAAEKLDVIAVRDGVTIKAAVNADAGKTAPIVVLLMGGNGIARLDRWDGTGDPNGNFLTRIRKTLAAQGFITALPDAPSDRQDRGLGNSRVGKAHAEDLAAVIRYMRRYSNAPVFVAGTSRGTISAANVASRMPAGEIAGLLLTATVTKANKRGNLDPVGEVALDKIKMPVLIAHHKDDDCYVCPPGNIPSLAEKFTASPSVKVSFFEGGSGWRGDPCHAFHAHGFLGIEGKVTAEMVAWMKAVAAKAKP
jgi:hypothetical protein